MAPEYSSVGVQFIEHDVAQVLEQAHPFCVVRQDSGVQHVRVGQDDMSAFPNCFSCIAWRIAVIREHSETVVEPFRKSCNSAS